MTTPDVGGLAGWRPIETTEALIARIQASPEPWRAVEDLRPGQRIRVQFAMYLRQIAAAMKADPTIGLRLYESMEGELERQIDAMMRPWEHRVYRDGRDQGRRDAEQEFREDYPELFADPPTTPAEHDK